MFIVAQVFGMIGTIGNIVSMQMNKKKNILIAFIIAGISFTINFAMLGAYSGAIICAIATVQTTINYIFGIKEKEFPKWLGIIYLIISAICGFISYKSIIDILPVLGGVTYALSIIQTKEKNIRRVTMINTLCWFIYDFSVGAYTAFISDIIFTMSTIIGIIRYDINWKNIKKE